MRSALVVPEHLAVLAPLVDAELIGAAELHLAATVDRLVRRDGQPDGLTDEEALALALAARAPRLGHVCVDLTEPPTTAANGDGLATDLAWPDPERWVAELESSNVVSKPQDLGLGPLKPLVIDDRRLYLHRYFSYEQAIAEDLRARTSGAETGSSWDPGDALLDVLFPPRRGEVDLQRQATLVALGEPVSVIAGGPGTGKTHTIARLLAAALAGGARDFAIAAPTGKAAARMTEAVRMAVDAAAGAFPAEVAERLRSAEATTIHSLLEGRPGAAFKRDRHRPLHQDLVIVDETSMVDLPLMSHLLEAVRPTARLVFVGDPDQLVSVEAGTVLADLVRAGIEPGTEPRPGPDGRGSTPNGPVDNSDGPMSGRVTVLDRVHRFGDTSGIAALADAVRTGDVEQAMDLLDGSRADVSLVDPAQADAVLEELVTSGLEAVSAASEGDIERALAAATQSKLLAAVHHGPNGRIDWGHRIGHAVLSRADSIERRGDWHVGRPLLVTRNDKLNRVSNGDTGITVLADGMEVVAFADPASNGGYRLVPPVRLGSVETWWSMTIHKSQGSEFPHVIIALPTASAVGALTRELIYTAVTRAQERVTVVASRDALVAGISRTVARSSGLADRLLGGAGDLR